MSGPIVFCADVGSVSRQRFGWAKARPAQIAEDASSPGALAEAVADSLCNGNRVALGFEAPLVLPVPGVEKRLGAGRVNEGNRPWSAGSGAAVLATALVQVPWILNEVKRQTHDTSLKLCFDADRFRAGEGDFLLWEAFVSGRSKIAGKNVHAAEAQLAATAFSKVLDGSDPNPEWITVGDALPFSLIGAAALWSGWISSVKPLREAPNVLKVRPARET